MGQDYVLNINTADSSTFNDYAEYYLWYTTSDFSGEPVFVVNEASDTTYYQRTISLNVE